jgi:hypothetical protein
LALSAARSSGDIRTINRADAGMVHPIYLHLHE